MSIRTLFREISDSIFELFLEERPPADLEPIIFELEAVLAHECEYLTKRYIDSSREDPFVELRTSIGEETHRTDIPVCRIYYAHKKENPVGVSFNEDFISHLEESLIEYAKVLGADGYKLNNKKVCLIN